MEILNLNTNEINQNGYHINKLTLDKIGFIFTAPIKIVPDDCLACDGYVLKIIDYIKLYAVIGKTFNLGTEAEDEFRIPDYNITKRFLQPGDNAADVIEAGLPQHTHSGTTSSNGAHTHTANSSGAHTHSVTVSINGSNADVGDPASYYLTNGSQHNGTRTLSGSAASNGAHTHSTTSNGEHTHTMTTGNASNDIYGKSATVQPPSQIVHLCIKYK